MILSFILRKTILQSVTRVIIFCTASLSLITTSVYAQGSAGATAPYESRLLVDMPTAGVLLKGAIGLNAIAFADGGILADISYAPWKNFNIGLGYSGTKILGTGDILGQGIPSLHLRYRIVDETLTIPAITLGMQTQGRGVVSNHEFQTKSPGVFAAVSKEYQWALGKMSWHGAMGYSLNLNMNGAGFNAWGGLEHSLGSGASLNIEVNPNFNQKQSAALLNVGLRWSIVTGVTIELQARDLFGNLPGAQGMTRTLSLEVVRLVGSGL